MKKLLLAAVAAGLLVCTGTALAQEAAPPAPEEKKISQEEEINKLIGELSSDEWSVREAATKKLIKIGAPAAKALEKLAESDDMEVRIRAKKILEALCYVSEADKKKIEKEIDLCLWGSAKPADDEVKKLIEELSSEDWETRDAAVKKLIEKGTDVLKEMAKLLESDDPDLKDSAEKIVKKIKENAKKQFAEQLKKTIEALKSLKTAPYYLTDTLAVKKEKAREEVVTGIIKGILDLKGELDGDGSKIVQRAGGGAVIRIQVVNGRVRKWVDGEEVTGLGKNPTPERVLVVMAAEAKLDMDLRLKALKILRERGEDAKAVKRLVKLLEKSKDELQLEAAKTLRKLTGQEFGPRKEATQEENEKALEEWKEWWEENKEDKKYRFTQKKDDESKDGIIVAPGMQANRKKLEEMAKKLAEQARKEAEKAVKKEAQEKKKAEKEEEVKKEAPEKKEEPKKEEEPKKSKEF